MMIANRKIYNQIYNQPIILQAKYLILCLFLTTAAQVQASTLSVDTSNEILYTYAKSTVDTQIINKMQSDKIPDKQKEWTCNALFMSYLDGCVDVYMGGKYTEEEAKGIVDTCKAKGKPYVKKFKYCKDAKFDDEP